MQNRAFIILAVFLALGFLIPNVHAFNWGDVTAYYSVDNSTTDIPENKTLDLSGHGLNLILKEDVSGGKFPFHYENGKINQALNFTELTEITTAYNDTVQNNNQTFLVNAFATNIFYNVSMNLWVYPYNYGNFQMGQRACSVICNYAWLDNSGFGERGIGLYSEGNNELFVAIGYQNGSSNEIVHKINASFTLANTTWTMISMTYNNINGDLRIYANGQLIKNLTILLNASNVTANAPNRFSLSRGLDDSTFANLDEIGLWNRTLSPAEVADLYNSGNGLAYGSSPTPNYEVQIIGPKDNETIGTVPDGFSSNGQGIGVAYGVKSNFLIRGNIFVDGRFIGVNDNIGNESPNFTYSSFLAHCGGTQFCNASIQHNWTLQIQRGSDGVYLDNFTNYFLVGNKTTPVTLTYPINHSIEQILGGNTMYLCWAYPQPLNFTARQDIYVDSVFWGTAYNPAGTNSSCFSTTHLPNQAFTTEHNWFLGMTNNNTGTFLGFSQGEQFYLTNNTQICVTGGTKPSSISPAGSIFGTGSTMIVATDSGGNQYLKFRWTESTSPTGSCSVLTTLAIYSLPSFTGVKAVYQNHASGNFNGYPCETVADNNVTGCYLDNFTTDTPLPNGNYQLVISNYDITNASQQGGILIFQTVVNFSIVNSCINCPITNGTLGQAPQNGTGGVIVAGTLPDQIAQIMNGIIGAPRESKNGLYLLAFILIMVTEVGIALSPIGVSPSVMGGSFLTLLILFTVIGWLPILLIVILGIIAAAIVTRFGVSHFIGGGGGGSGAR